MRFFNQQKMLETMFMKFVYIVFSVESFKT